jgi:hypothetical protein
MAWTVRLMRRVEQRARRSSRQDLSRAKAWSPVVLLVVLGQVTAVVGGAGGGAGALVGVVGQDEDLARA